MKYIPILLLMVTIVVTGQVRSVARAEETFVVARLQYDGGGDWYSNPSSLPNLMRFVQQHTGIPTGGDETVVSPASEELFSHPIVYMNGHGNVAFSPRERQNLRTYLTSGGFLIADDNYGMDTSFRREIGEIFPDKELVLLPKDHPIFSSPFAFSGGMPKIHEHDGDPARALALFHEGRMIVFYSYQSDLGDGWEDPAVHEDPEEVRRNALQMGTNIIVWALTH